MSDGLGSTSWGFNIYVLVISGSIKSGSANMAIEAVMYNTIMISTTIVNMRRDLIVYEHYCPYSATLFRRLI